MKILLIILAITIAFIIFKKISKAIVRYEMRNSELASRRKRAWRKNK